MARTKGTFSLSANIEPRAAAPLDARERVALISDLTASGTFPYPYEGMEVYVVEEKKKYVLIGDDPTVANNWQEVGSGGGGSSSAIKDVDDFPTSNIENIIYRTQASTFTTNFNQSNDQMILSKKGFTYTENTVDGVFIREWTTDIENYVKIGSVYKRVNKIIYKYSTELHCYHKIMYNDEVLHEASESGGFTIFTFKTISAYYAGDNINQKTERLAKYSDTPFTGTQAEWDALTIDKKLTYKQVNITDDESTANFDVYSTIETKTNKVWIDGKPIYRKVLEFSRTNQDSFSLGISSSPIVDKFVSVDGYIYGNNNLQHGLYCVGDTDQFRYYIGSKNDIIVMVGSSFPEAPFTGYFIIEYTKTTD